MSEGSEVRHANAEERTERLVAGLVEDLQPVVPLPRLAVSVGVVLSIWAGLVSIVLLDPKAPGLVRSFADPSVVRIWSVCLAALVLSAIGGCVAAIAAGRPGQDRLEQLATLLGAIGLAIGLGTTATAFVLLGVQPADSLSMDGACLEKGVAIALLPVAALVFFVFRSWVGRPLVAAVIALAAGAAASTVVTMLGCEGMTPQHLLLGHVDVPILAAVLGAYPLMLGLRRYSR